MKYSIVIGITLKVTVSLFFQRYPETKMMTSNYLFNREKQQILTCENQLSDLSDYQLQICFLSIDYSPNCFSPKSTKKLFI